ncbi:hypothetical protein JCM5350_007493 [Sporobolomyces pararoseus]
MSGLRPRHKSLLRRSIFSLPLFLLSFSTVGSSKSKVYAQTTTTSIKGNDLEQLGFYNPKDTGGSWLTTWNGAVHGEPLNVVISANSDPSILTYEGFLDYCYSLWFSPQCLNWYDAGSQQQANLGDGNGLLNQRTILRYNYDDPIFGTCSQTLQGGNHFRVFRQNGTQANSGAWFLAVSKEHNLGKKHLIIPNGYDLGRDEVVYLATNPNGTRSPVSKALYSTSVTAVQGPTYFNNITAKDINHEIGIDGRIAVLTISIVEEGNGETPSDVWVTRVSLPDVLIVVGTIVFTILSLGLFCFLHYHHNKHKLVAVAPWEAQGKGGGKGDDFPLLSRGV